VHLCHLTLQKKGTTDVHAEIIFMTAAQADEILPPPYGEAAPSEKQ
jgi:hypothetical protein